MAKQSITLTNMLTNPSFENTGWQVSSACSIAYDSSIKHSGSYSLKVTSTSSSESLITTTNTYALTQNHIYYVSVWFYETANNVGSMQCYWPIAEPLVGIATVDSTKLNQWQQLTWRNIRSSWSTGTAQVFRFDFEDMASGKIAYIDDAMLIDLTTAFGSGNEPSQDWCRANIDYFTGTITKTFELPDVYDLTTAPPSKIKTNDILNCPYSGSVQSITLPKGTYKLECWGAQGGSYNTVYQGGKGGYSVGTLTIPNKSTFYLYVGSKGNAYNGSSSSGTATGGFNGGGSVTSLTYRSSGGGGTDIRLKTDSLYARVIVAGGGGGASPNYIAYQGGVGGGTTGFGYNGSNTANTSHGGVGGTQTAGGAKGTNTTYGANGSFGAGGKYTALSTSYGAGGGGGWYGGGSGPGIGGGGSGYVYTSSTASNYPSGCLLTSDYYLTDASTVAGNTSFTSPTGISETGHSDNGYIRITVINIKSGNTLIKTPTVLPSGYTQLKYIQTSGTQYIDTGIKADTNTGFDATFEMLNGQSSSPYYNLFGTRGTTSSGTGETANMFRIDTIPVSGGGTEFKWGTTTYDSGITGSQKVNIKLLNKVYTKPDGTTITLNGTITNNYNIYLGCLNKEGSTYGNFASLKIYNFKFYDGSTLIRNFVPVKNSSGTIGLYDTVNSKFYTNSGTGTFTAGEEVSPWKNYKNIFVKTSAVLPSGYTQLEYIQSSGTQYINTNTFAYFIVEITYQIMSIGSTHVAIFGSRTSSSSKDQFVFGYAAHKSPKVWRFDYENIQQSLDSSLSWNGKHTFKYDNDDCAFTIDGNKMPTETANVISISSSLPLYLFALNTNGTAGEIGNTRIYSFKLYNNFMNYQNNKAVINLIPAKNSSGTLGMYDTVNNKFYTNAGTGTFIAGPEVSPWKSVKGLWVKTDSTTWKQAL